MGSTGSGRFGNYNIGGADAGIAATKGSSSGGIGGGVGEIECPDIIENIRLEDVATSEYYSVHRSLPAAGTAVQLRNRIFDGRLVVEAADTHEIIGNLPTGYNYLLNCIKRGKRYHGGVIATNNVPVQFVVVTLHG